MQVWWTGVVGAEAVNEGHGAEHRGASQWRNSIY